MEKSEFRKHDIIVKIGGSVKLVVKKLFEHGGVRVEPLKAIGHISIPIADAEIADYVKVGRYSLRKGEIDDGEI